MSYHLPTTTTTLAHEQGVLEGFERFALPILSRRWNNETGKGLESPWPKDRYCPWCGTFSAYGHAEDCALLAMMCACGIA